MTDHSQDLLRLADEVRGMFKADNAVDVRVEVALFVPDFRATAIRANSAGTKVIYTNPSGKDETCWAWDWTADERRQQTVIELTARAHSTKDQDNVG